VDDLQRQIRIALFAFLIIIPAGIVGFMVIEQMTMLDALYFTLVTLSTIGYGDISPATPAGKLFTMTLIVFGLSSFAFAAQATIAIITSPIIRNARIRRQNQRRIDLLVGHYVICGSGELVDRTIEYLQQSAHSRRRMLRESQYKTVDMFLDRLLKSADRNRYLWFRSTFRIVAQVFLAFSRRDQTILDIIVVITQDATYAEHLRQSRIMVIEGNPTDDESLENAGIKRATAAMILLESDTETLLTVLAARTLSPAVRITASVRDDDFGRKIIRVGASTVLTPFDTAGQFLNNATLRPAVNHFFNGLLFEDEISYALIQLEMRDDSPWINTCIGDLRLQEQFSSGIIGICHASGTYTYMPPADHILQEDEILLAITPSAQTEHIQRACRDNTPTRPYSLLWQRLGGQHQPVIGAHRFTLEDAETAAQNLSKHFIICGNDQVARSAISRLDPMRPFVIISDDSDYTAAMLDRGFRVVHGSPTSEETLLKAGIRRAQAIMVSQEKNADAVLTVLVSRTLNRSILITVTANTDDMIKKLERAGADRVVSPFHVAARFVILETTQPAISGFLDSVLYNYITGLETTEIYVEDDSVWIGKTIAEIDLYELYQAGIIGIRRGSQQSYVYAPEPDEIVMAHDVLIIVTPMQQSDTLRNAAHGGTIRRPTTLRSSRNIR
jgi:voltage-gated potassium channel